MEYIISVVCDVRIHFSDLVKVNGLPCALAQGQNK